MASAFPYLIWFGNAPVVNGNGNSKPTQSQAQQLVGMGGTGPADLKPMQVEGTRIDDSTSPSHFNTTYASGKDSEFKYPNVNGPGNANTVMTGFFDATFKVRYIDQNGNDVTQTKVGVVMQMKNGDLFFRPSVQSIDDWDDIQSIITMEITTISPVGSNVVPAVIGFNPGIVDIPVIPCFARGTLIATDRGEVAVEDLRAGDLVMTRDHGAQPVRWIGTTVVSAEKLDLMPVLRPIRIRAGALAAGVPARDLVVSPQHRILVSSRIAARMFGAAEVLVAAKHLLGIDGIELARDMAEVEYFHLLLDGHQILTSDGAETESLYLGTEARKAIGAEAWREIVTLFPELAEAGAEQPRAARDFVRGRQARRLVARQQQNARQLCA